VRDDCPTLKYSSLVKHVCLKALRKNNCLRWPTEINNQAIDALVWRQKLITDAMVQDNPVSKFTIYGLYDRVSIPGKKRNFFFATTLKPNTGTHPASTQRRPEALPRGPTSLNMNLPFISEVQNVWILTSAFPTPIHGMVVRQICMPYFLFIFHFI
jgi:hypothetical protein